MSQRPFTYIISNLFLSASSINKIREKGGTSTRKLIGHSGPVYSVSFDPLSGSAAPPKYLLSSSADATTRLWSMDTMTNVVAYRGHQNPVWDVEWSPMGVYFATGSRDRTARLWSTDRTACLRVYAGHLSDVDVCDISLRLIPDPDTLSSALNFTRILFTSRQVPATGQRDCGMSSEDRVYACLLDIKGLSLHFQSVRTASILLQPVCIPVHCPRRKTDHIC